MAARVNGHDSNLAAGIVAGLAGGLAGTWVMNHVQASWSNAFHGYESQSAPGRHDSRDWQERNEEANANELAAQAIATYTIDRPLSREELKVAAPVVHFAFGAAMGALYGGLLENAPNGHSRGGIGSGAAFGTAVWAAADEIAMPLLGLSRNYEFPLDAHAQSFVAHLAFGVAAELVRRGVRAML